MEVHAASDTLAREPTGVPDPCAQNTEQQPLSKNARKKVARHQAYEALRPERRRKNKEKRLAKREAYKDAIRNGEIEAKKNAKVIQVPSNLRILLDCSFDHLMNDKEIKSMTSQIIRCHADNRKAKHPSNVIVTGWNAKIADHFRVVHRNQQENWERVKFYKENYLNEADGTIPVEGIRIEDLVYLSADSQNTIETIDESKVYIIGGIVDKNRHKNLCFDQATRQGIQTARLPISEYIRLSGRTVLTVNHVFEIMSLWLEYVELGASK